jgi:hypothetical protein
MCKALMHHVCFMQSLNVISSDGQLRVWWFCMCLFKPWMVRTSLQAYKYALVPKMYHVSNWMMKCHVGIRAVNLICLSWNSIKTSYKWICILCRTSSLSFLRDVKEDAVNELILCCCHFLVWEIQIVKELWRTCMVFPLGVQHFCAIAFLTQDSEFNQLIDW